MEEEQAEEAAQKINNNDTFIASVTELGGKFFVTAKRVSADTPARAAEDFKKKLLEEEGVDVNALERAETIAEVTLEEEAQIIEENDPVLPEVTQKPGERRKLSSVALQEELLAEQALPEAIPPDPEQQATGARVIPSSAEAELLEGDQIFEGSQLLDSLKAEAAAKEQALANKAQVERGGAQ